MDYDNNCGSFSDDDQERERLPPLVRPLLVRQWKIYQMSLDKGQQERSDYGINIRSMEYRKFLTLY